MICKCTWERELGKEEVVMCNGMVEEEMEKVVEGSHSGKVEDATLVVEGICSSREDEEWEMVEEDFDSSKEVVEMEMESKRHNLLYLFIYFSNKVFI